MFFFKFNFSYLSYYSFDITSNFNSFELFLNIETPRAACSISNLSALFLSSSND